MDYTPQKYTEWQWLEIFIDQRRDLIKIYKAKIAALRMEIRTENEGKYRVKGQVQEYEKQWWVELYWQRADERIGQAQKQIRKYEFFISKMQNQGRPGQNITSKIKDSDIQAAKEFPITELLGGHFRRSGQGRFQARCPFHANGQERTASLVIYPDNKFHCYSCHKHGDSIDFVRHSQNLSFIEAVKFLCQS